MRGGNGQTPYTWQPPAGGTVSNNVQWLGTLRTILAENGVSNAVTFGVWVNAVQPGGVWDYKYNGGNATDDLMGNFNFGATGNVVTSPLNTLSGAGIVQLATNPSGSDGGFPYIFPPYGDDVQGQAEINSGINGGC